MSSEVIIKDVPLRGVRGMIADKMLASLQTTAQLTHHASADFTNALARKAELAKDNKKVSVEDLVMEAVVATLPEHPDLNGRVGEKVVHLQDQIDLGVAIALPGNLLAAPAIFNAGAKSLLELREARQDLAERARTNKLTVTEMTGGTFSISNLGFTRVEQFTPILNAPQIAILGIGRTVPTLVPEGDGTRLAQMTGLSLTFDHRAVDGAPAAAFLTALCERLETK